MGKSYKKKMGGFLGFGEGANTATVPKSGPSYWEQLTGSNPRPGFNQQPQQQRFAGGSNAASNAALADAKYMLNGGKKSRRRTRKNKTRRVKSRRGKSRRG